MVVEAVNKFFARNFLPGSGWWLKAIPATK
jgi:hypothetical protein